MANEVPCKVVDDAILILNDLKISFRRTIRVPDNNVTHFLPPDLGTFPLRRFSQYASKLPKAMADKGGLFFPMYQKEAMWIDFECKKSYFIKIYVGGTRGDVPGIIRALQDYVVVPEQRSNKWRR
jgi:hypothetical protein